MFGVWWTADETIKMMVIRIGFKVWDTATDIIPNLEVTEEVCACKIKFSLQLVKGGKVTTNV